MSGMIYALAGVPITGDGFRPWIAAVILIVSIVILVAMIVMGKRSGDDSERDDSYRDEDK